MAVAKKARKKTSPIITISAAELVKELPGSRNVTYKAGAAIFREGSKAESCYLIVKGKVEILKKTKGGKNVPLAQVKPGEFLGEMAMLSGDRRSASAVALTAVKAVVIQHAEFESLLSEQHPFAGRLSLQLSNLLAARCHRLLRLLANQPDLVPPRGKKAPPVDVRAVLNRVYTLWAV
jgi:CRP-like cAMP-binding protein